MLLKDVKMHVGNENEPLVRALTGLQNTGSLEELLEAAFDAVITLDARGRITSWSPAAEQMYGWTAREALGKTPSRLFWPSPTPQETKNRRQRQARLKRGETLQGQEVHCRRDGSSISVRYVSRAFFKPEGELEGYLTVYRENQDAKSAFHESEEKYRRIVETSNEGIWEIDKDTRTTFVNRRMAEMLGYSVDEMMGRSSFEFIFPGDSPDGERRLERAKTGVPSKASEFRFRRKDGSVLWALVTSSPRLDEQGRFLGSFAMMVDITERRQLEQQLEQNHRRLNEILESIQDDFYVLDRDWNFVYASRQFTSKIGKEPGDFVGKNIWEMFPKHLGMAFEENLRAAMEKRQIRRFEIPGQYTNAWYRMTAFPSEEGITVLGTDITERKRAEEILRERERKFFLLFEKAGFAAALSEMPDGVLVDVNEEWVKQFGYTRQEVVGKTTLELNINPDAEGRARTLAQIRETGLAHNIEFRLRTRSGEWRDYLTSVDLIDIGEKKYLFNALQDITERKRAEQALRENQATLQSFYDSAPFLMGIVELDGDRAIALSGNRAMADFLSMRPSDLPGQAGEGQGVPDDIRQLWIENYQKSQTDGTPVQFEYEHPHQAGPRWLRVTVAFIGTGSSSHPQFSFVAEDITGRRQANEEHQKAERRYHIVGEVIPFGVWETDVEGNATYLSPLFLEMTGQTLEEHRQSWQTLIQAEETDSLVEAWRECVRTGALWDREFYIRGQDGSYHAIHARGLPLFNAAGEVTSYVGINFDITERKRVEEALRESEKQLRLLNESLAQKVEEKTAEVRRLASDLVKAVQRERHRISHILHDDLQQRIYAIQVQLTFLHHEFQKVDETVQEGVADIEKQLAEILEITRHLSIDLSPPILQDEGLSQAINWLAGQMQQRYGLPIEVQADESFILPNEELQVFLFNCVRELLFNVVKHSGASRALVALHWRDGDLQIEVRDDGVGFPPEILEQQLIGEMSGEEGLQASYGLPMIRNQLSLFEGHMEIDSEPGQRTKVFLSVPVRQAG